MTTQLRPLSGALGAELVGVDLREPQPAEVRAAAAAALRERHLVLVRGQDIELADQARFVSWFGSVDTSGYPPGMVDEPAMFISNTRPEGVARNGLLLKHQDHCFFDRVLPAICLYAEETPDDGGDTIFANAELAFERLPAPLRARIASLSARHVYDYASDYGTVRFRIATSPDAPRAEHPVAWPHPRSGRTVLFVNELMTDGIVGLPEDESEELLATLWSYLDDPAVQHRHRWRRGDVLLWDNRSLQHGRTSFASTARRSLRRLQVELAS